MVRSAVYSPSSAGKRAVRVLTPADLLVQAQPRLIHQPVHGRGMLAVHQDDRGGDRLDQIVADYARPFRGEMGHQRLGEGAACSLADAGKADEQAARAGRQVAEEDGFLVGQFLIVAPELDDDAGRRLVAQEKAPRPLLKAFEGDGSRRRLQAAIRSLVATAAGDTDLAAIEHGVEQLIVRRDVGQRCGRAIAVIDRRADDDRAGDVHHHLEQLDIAEQKACLGVLGDQSAPDDVAADRLGDLLRRRLLRLAEGIAALRVEDVLDRAAGRRDQGGVGMLLVAGGIEPVIDQPLGQLAAVPEMLIELLHLLLHGLDRAHAGLADGGEADLEGVADGVAGDRLQERHDLIAGHVGKGAAEQIDAAAAALEARRGEGHEVGVDDPVADLHTAAGDDAAPRRRCHRRIGGVGEAVEELIHLTLEIGQDGRRGDADQEQGDCQDEMIRCA